MSLLVVGSVAFDCIETPHGSADDVLGGSAAHAAVAASFFTAPRLVGVVGTDFPDEHRRTFTARGIDTSGLTTAEGRTFRWKGRYHEDMNVRDTLEVHLNVLGDFDPVLPDSFRDSSHVFLANNSPAVQLRVLDQVRRPEVVFADTMDLWVDTQRPALLTLLSRLHGLLLNDSEAVALTGEKNLVRAGHAVRRLGPRHVLLKKGEHGAMLFSDEGTFLVPAYPSPNVIDPTGAGDSFAGALLGHLAAEGGPLTHARLRRAIGYGTVVASLIVEGFGAERLLRADRREIDGRLEEFRHMISF
jgi:sugar/nucleoside kinase (ribokinase family)